MNIQRARDDIRGTVPRRSTLCFERLDFTRNTDEAGAEWRFTYRIIDPGGRNISHLLVDACSGMTTNLGIRLNWQKTIFAGKTLAVVGGSDARSMTEILSQALYGSSTALSYQEKII